MSCEIYTNNSLWGAVFSAIFAVTIFLSYAPQQVVIVLRQTTEGINPYYLMMMNLGSTFAFANALILSRPIVSCCRTSIGALDCFGSLQGLAQLFGGFMGPTILLLLAVRFREPGEVGEGVVRSAKIVALVDVISWLFVIFVTDPTMAQSFATVFGLISLSVGCVQYLPQLYTTFKLKHTGSLSILMMLMQIPGGYIWCLSLASRKGSHWSTWIGLFATATFQLILLIMALYYSSKQSVEYSDRLVTPPPPPQPQPQPQPEDTFPRPWTSAGSAERNESHEEAPLLAE